MQHRPLTPDECATTIQGEVPESAVGGSVLSLTIDVENRSDAVFPQTGPVPVVLTYRWLLVDRSWLIDAPRLGLPAPLGPGDTVSFELPITVPSDIRGPAYLRISLAQETVCYFDDIDPVNGLWATVYLTPHGPRSGEAS